MKKSNVIKQTIFCLFVLFFSCEKKVLNTKAINPNSTAPPTKPSSTVYDSADIVIYGGTSAGIIAAVEAARLGKSVIVISPDKRIGGMTTNGLGATDIGNPSIISGLAGEFYTKIAQAYNIKSPRYNFEPHVALKVFNDLIYNYQKQIKILYNERIDLSNGIIKEASRINSIILESGKTIEGKEFIDASYEGDLLKSAGITYTYGREATSQYNESLNGIYSNGQIPGKISPYLVEGDPTSGILPRVNYKDINLNIGQASSGIQAYNFRLTLTDNPNNRLTFQKPQGYNENDYLLLYRLIRSKSINPKTILILIPIGDNKYDCNNGGPTQFVSTDYIAGNFDYTAGNYSIRDSIYKKHKIYTEGLFWTLQNSDSIPVSVRNIYKKYGLAKDEFTENNNWPNELYIREARRMVSDYVITQKTVMGQEEVLDPIAEGSYTIDSHIVQYFIGKNGFLCREGCLGTKVSKPYKISYKAITPRERECTNLLVPVCLSASHVAYSTIRMEPQYMMLGQAAGDAASIAIDERESIQKIDYSILKLQLLKNNIIK